LAQGGKRTRDAGVGLELRAARALEHRPALLDDAAHVARAERDQGARDESGEALPDAEDLEPVREAAARHGANRGVHPPGFAAAGEDRDARHGVLAALPLED